MSAKKTTQSYKSSPLARSLLPDLMGAINSLSPLEDNIPEDVLSFSYCYLATKYEVSESDLSRIHDPLLESEMYSSRTLSDLAHSTGWNKSEFLENSQSATVFIDAHKEIEQNQKLKKHLSTQWERVMSLNYLEHVDKQVEAQRAKFRKSFIETVYVVSCISTVYQGLVSFAYKQTIEEEKPFRRQWLAHTYLGQVAQSFYIAQKNKTVESPIQTAQLVLEKLDQWKGANNLEEKVGTSKEMKRQKRYGLTKLIEDAARHLSEGCAELDDDKLLKNYVFISDIAFAEASKLKKADAKNLRAIQHAMVELTNTLDRRGFESRSSMAVINGHKRGWSRKNCLAPLYNFEL